MAKLADILEEEFLAIEEFLQEYEELALQRGYLTLRNRISVRDSTISGERRVAELLAARKEKSK